MKKIIILTLFSFTIFLNAQTSTQLCTNFYNVDGNIGIATENTQGYKLAVKGNVIAEKIKVQVYPWADFVFYEDYKLPTLAEVEKHIKEKGHLEHIPSAKEVAKNGIHLGEMDKKLLQKIEELTLYIIQKEKKIQQQRARLEKIEAQITKN